MKIPDNFKINGKTAVLILLATTIGIYLAFGIFRIGKFVTTDEQFWVYKRIPAYWNGIFTKDPKQTRINDKPGVSIALISGIGLLSENDPATNHKISGNKNLEEYRTEYTELMHSFFRLPLLITNAILALYFFWITKKTTDNKWIALWTVSFVSSFPILLGITRVINPDALLWSFSFAAGMSYLALLKKNEKKFLFLTAGFTGLALLSKYAANILFPFFLAASLAEYMIAFKDKFSANLQASADYLKRHASYIMLILLGSAVIFSLGMPSVFIKPKHLYWGTLGAPGFDIILIPIFIFILLMLLDAVLLKSRFIHKFFSLLSLAKDWPLRAINLIALTLTLFALANWMSKNRLLDLGKIPIDARSSENFTSGVSFLEKTILEFYPFVFTIPPFVLLLLLLLLARNVYTKKPPFQLATTCVSALIIMFLTGGTISGIFFTPRYDVLLFPFVAFLGALGLHSLLEKFNMTAVKYVLASLAVIAVSALTLFHSKPFYYSYVSPLLPLKYTTNNTWGFGGYEAAEYLNKLPGSQNLTVWADYRGTCEFFHGDCILQKAVSGENHPDYYVLTRRGQSRERFRQLDKFERLKQDPEWELLIGGRPENFVKIFKSEE